MPSSKQKEGHHEQARNVSANGEGVVILRKPAHAGALHVPLLTCESFLQAKAFCQQPPSAGDGNPIGRKHPDADKEKREDDKRVLVDPLDPFFHCFTRWPRPWSPAVGNTAFHGWVRSRGGATPAGQYGAPRNQCRWCSPPAGLTTCNEKRSARRPLPLLQCSRRSQRFRRQRFSCAGVSSEHPATPEDK